MKKWSTAAGLALLAFGVGASLWRAPFTFPLSSARWWASTGLVLAAWVLVLVAAFAAKLDWPALRVATWLVPSGLLAGLGLSGRFLFPATAPRFWAGVFLLSFVWAAAVMRSFRGLDGRRGVLALCGVLVGVPWGVAWSVARRPPPPGTRPSLSTLPRDDGGASVPVRVPCGTATLVIWPLLTFTDSSRDGFWPGVAPTGFEGTPSREGRGRRASLFLETLERGVRLEAATELPLPVHSHLNHFTELVLEGVKAPKLRFPAAGPEAYEALPFDYPQGAPVRFATFLPGGELLVAQATSAEKGPFTTLARGPLARGAPLVVELLEGAARLCSVTFLDFTAQADVTTSPAAGEGIPVNVAQFGIPPGGAGLPVLHLSLGETGIGAGRDTVTHAAGVYANRLLVTP